MKKCLSAIFIASLVMAFAGPAQVVEPTAQTTQVAVFNPGPDPHTSPEIDA